MGGYGLSRGGWLQLVMVLLAALLAYGFLRAGLQIAGCQGAFPAAHGLLAAITGAPALLPLVLANRWLNAAIGFLVIGGTALVLAINAPLGELLALMPESACRTGPEAARVSAAGAFSARPGDPRAEADRIAALLALDHQQTVIDVGDRIGQLVQGLGHVIVVQDHGIARA